MRSGERPSQLSGDRRSWRGWPDRCRARREVELACHRVGHPRRGRGWPDQVGSNDRLRRGQDGRIGGPRQPADRLRACHRAGRHHRRRSAVHVAVERHRAVDFGQVGDAAAVDLPDIRRAGVVPGMEGSSGAERHPADAAAGANAAPTRRQRRCRRRRPAPARRPAAALGTRRAPRAPSPSVRRYAPSGRNGTARSPRARRRSRSSPRARRRPNGRRDRAPSPARPADTRHCRIAARRPCAVARRGRRRRASAPPPAAGPRTAAAAGARGPAWRQEGVVPRRADRGLDGVSAGAISDRRSGCGHHIQRDVPARRPAPRRPAR